MTPGKLIVKPDGFIGKATTTTQSQWQKDLFRESTASSVRGLRVSCRSAVAPRWRWRRRASPGSYRATVDNELTAGGHGDVGGWAERRGWLGWRS